VTDSNPFYSDAAVAIYRGDARSLPLPDDSVHLICTSPPYNCGASYDGFDDWLPWDQYWHGLIEPSMRECYRVLAHGGRIAVNLANVVRQNILNEVPRHEYCRTRAWRPPGANGDSWAVMLAPRIWNLLEAIGFLPREQLTWIKAARAEDIATSTAWGSWRSASNPVLRAVAEPVFIAAKGTHTRQPGDSDLTGEEFKAWTRNAWTIPNENTHQFDHPCVFPLELPRRLIKLYSYVGDTVLDPFMGSGTTLQAARLLGRRAIGVDQSPRYCRVAAGRVCQLLLPETVA
jgi:site-specific DNA-methyltransferase (adenine-specific)